MAHLRAVVVIQPPGLGGRPSIGHLRTATTNASCTASSATSMSPKIRIRVATARPDSSRKIRPIAVGSAEGEPSSRRPLGVEHLPERANLDGLADRFGGL